MKKTKAVALLVTSIMLLTSCNKNNEVVTERDKEVGRILTSEATNRLPYIESKVSTIYTETENEKVEDIRNVMNIILKYNSGATNETNKTYMQFLKDYEEVVQHQNLKRLVNFAKKYNTFQLQQDYATVANAMEVLRCKYDRKNSTKFATITEDTSLDVDINFTARELKPTLMAMDSKDKVNANVLESFLLAAYSVSSATAQPAYKDMKSEIYKEIDTLQIEDKTKELLKQYIAKRSYTTNYGMDLISSKINWVKGNLK